MHRVNYPLDGQDLELDICSRCEVVWFDANELDQMPQLPGAQVNLRVPAAVMDEVRQNKGESGGHHAPFQLTIEDYGIGWSKHKPGMGGWKILVGLFGMPVERENNLGLFPAMVWLSLGGFLLTSMAGFIFPPITEALGFSSSEPWKWAGLSLFTYAFVHGGWVHLLTNLYFFWIFGDNVEEQLGHLKFLGLVVGSSVAGALAQYFFTPYDEFLLVGASGSIAGLVGYYFLAFPRAKMALIFWFVWFRLPAYFYVILWFAMQFVLVRLQLLGQSRISALAHLGGLAFGLFYWFLVRPSSQERVK